MKTVALVGRRDGRNFGYGRQLSYAGRQALEDLFADGHFATVKAHIDRWQAFVRWCRSEDGPGHNDARQIDRQTLEYYVTYLRQQIQQGELCIATAQNRLSSVNRTLAALRGDQDVRVISPSLALGLQRSTVRTRAPDGRDIQDVLRVVKALGEQQHDRVAVIVMLARTTGMRLREAILADLPRLHREAKHLAGSISRTVPKAADQGHQRHVGLSSLNKLTRRSNLRVMRRRPEAATCWPATKATPHSCNRPCSQPAKLCMNTG